MMGKRGDEGVRDCGLVELPRWMSLDRLWAAVLKHSGLASLLNNSWLKNSRVCIISRIIRLLIISQS